MKITWLGHASFLIESADGVRVITDPYQSGAFGGALSLGAIAEPADIVTVSHEHDDHNAVDSVPGNPVVLRRSGDEKGIAFRVVESYHDNSKGRQRGKNRIFCIRVDNINVIHFGDLGHSLEPSQVQELNRLSSDVLLLPVGGYFTIDAATADEVIAALEPSVVIPMHVKNSKVNFPIAPVETFLKNKQNVKRLGGSWAEIDRDNLPSKTEIWVLEPEH